VVGVAFGNAEAQCIGRSDVAESLPHHRDNALQNGLCARWRYTKGKVKKVGLAPVMRDGIEYEFTIFMEMDQAHNGFVGKDRTRLFDNQIIEKPNADMGGQLLDWLNNGIEPATAPVLREQQVAAFSDSINQAQTMDELKEAYVAAATVCDVLHDEQTKRNFNRLTNMRKHELETDISAAVSGDVAIDRINNAHDGRHGQWGAA